MVKPEWERGQSRASEQVRGLGRPLLQASPVARNLRPPQSPGGWVLVQGQQVGSKGWKAAPHTLRVWEASNSLLLEQMLRRGQCQSFSYEQHIMLVMILKENIYVMFVGLCHLINTIVDSMHAIVKA